jgi:alcohol dehydrogenase YqhD (iron-dependent ADH family)
MGLSDRGSDSETALAGIEAYENFLRSLNMPTSIRELGVEVDETAIDKLAWMCTFEGKRTIGSMKILGLEEIKTVYRLAL